MRTTLTLDDDVVILLKRLCQEHQVAMKELVNQAPTVWIPGPTERHVTILGPFMQEAVSRATLVPDAHLAALAIEHGLTLCSTDGDFARFPGLRWENPLRVMS